MIGLHIADTAIDWPAEMTHYRVWDAGAAWCQVHAAPGVFDWTRLDELMAKAGDRHVTYVVGGCPRWAAKHPDAPHFAPWLGPGSNSMPYDLRIFWAFFGRLVRRYAGRIDAYEIWNEPQLADFLFPYTDAECNALARMTAAAHRIVAAHDPQALVLAASVLPRPSSGGMAKAGRWLRALQRKGWPVDAFTCHIYPEVGAGTQRWRAMLADVTGTLAAMGAPTRRVWITETAFGLLGPAVPDAKARQLVRGTYAAAGSRPVYWYALSRPDLGGMQVAIDPDSAAWSQITMEG